MNNSKIIEWRKLKTSPKTGVKRTVLVGGCFDIFHFGHLQFLLASAKEGESLIVALESDEFMHQKKKKKPFHTQEQRAEILAQMECVTSVVLLPYFTKDDEYLEVVKAINPDVISLTEGDSQLVNKTKQAKLVGAQVKVFPLLSAFSSSKIHPYASISRN